MRSTKLETAGAVAGEMPAHVSPMLVLLSDLPSQLEQYGFEFKWDGVRALAYFQNGGIRIDSRNLKDITASYPELAPLARVFKGRTAVLDGEIVALGEKGRPSFGRLQHRMGVFGGNAQSLAEEIPATYMIFDLVYLDGFSLLDVTYSGRRELLESLHLSEEHWQTPPSSQGDGDAILEAAREQRLEGVVSKKLDSTYHPGARNGDWRKTKLVDEQEFVIGGWQPIRKGKGIGSLLIGYYDRTPEQAKKSSEPQRLLYVGKVGTGYTDTERMELQKKLERISRKTSPFDGGEGWPGAHYTKPSMVAQVQFRGHASGRHLRQPSYKGLRTDKSPRDVVLEKKAGK